MHTSTPRAVGRAMARPVHLRLPVSFQMVMQVVEQGQWKSEKSMTHRAVVQVQPLAVSSRWS